ncbi:RNase H family protein [Fervidobacterium sp.]
MSGIIEVAHVYTDGSFRDGIIGVGIVFEIDGNIQEFSFRIESEELSVHRNVSGEIYAVMYAIFYGYKIGIKRLSVFHDYSGLAHWVSGEWKAKTNLTQLYKSFVEHFSNSMKIEFVKVDAHKGDLLNNRADKMAKEALEGNVFAPYFEEFIEFVNKLRK